MTPWPRPDFLARPPRQALAVRLFALAGAAALLLALLDAWSVHAEFERRAAVASNGPRASTEAGLKAAETSPPNEGDANARRAAARLSAAISYPWSAALASLEMSTPAGVQWLIFDHSIDSGEVRLEGQAVDPSTALRVVDSFNARPGWRDVALVRLQRVDARDGASASSPFRFAIEARLQPAALTTAAGSGGP